MKERKILLCGIPKHAIVFSCGVNLTRRNIVENLNFTGESIHKQRAHDLQEEARIERFIQEKKERDEKDWLQRRLRRNHKTK